MMNKIVSWALIAGCLFVVSFPASAQKAANKPSKSPVKLTYVRRDYGFGLNKPSGWANIRKPPDDALAGFWLDTPAAYDPIIGIRTQRAYGPVVPPELGQILDTQYKTAYPDYTLQGIAHFKVAGKEAVSIAYTSREPMTQALTRTRRIYLVHEGKLLLFEVAAEIADFDTYAPIFEKMISSVRWIPVK